MPPALTHLVPVAKRNLWPAVLAALLVLPLYSMIDRTQPIEFVGGDTIPHTAELPGDIQLIRYAVVNRRCAGTTYRWIKDPAGYVWTIGSTPSLSVDVPIDRTVQRLAGRSFDLPEMNFTKDETQGTAIFLSEIHFVCPWLIFPKNPLQMLWPIRVILPDIRFEVVKRAKQ